MSILDSYPELQDMPTRWRFNIPVGLKWTLLPDDQVFISWFNPTSGSFQYMPLRVARQYMEDDRA